MDLIVQEIERLTDRISLFLLAGPDGSALPGYTAGAHLDFDLDGIGTRSYSLIDLTPPVAAPEAYRIAVQREENGEGGSKAMHALAIGDRLRASDPKNDFALHAGDAPAVLLAGGIGVTPLVSFATALAARGTPFALHYATRSADQAAFGDRLAAICGASLVLCPDDTCPADLPALVRDAPQGAHIYCCGPRGMIEAVRELADAEGIARDHVHFELFTNPDTHEGDRPFEVEINDGRVFTIPADRSIIEVLEEEGVDLMYDCQRGDCGICQTDVLEGEPDHRDVVLSDAERSGGKVMQICVSRARSARLKLDI